MSENGTQVYNIRLGNSLKSGGSPKSRSLHTLRYNFEPDSMNRSKGSLIEDEKGESTLTFPNTNQTNEPHLFRGQQAKSKESEFLLILDESTNEYVLEKLDSTFNFRNIRQPKRLHSTISNLEDAETGNASDLSSKRTSTKTAGLMKPPVDFIPQSPKVSKAHEQTDDNFSDLEEILEKELSS